MKAKVTKRQVNDNYLNVIRVGYCGAQYLLYCREADYFTSSRTYGWRADVYEINKNVCLVTGYGPFGNIEASYELVDKYEKKASKVLEKERDYQRRADLLNKLIDKFVKECLAEKKKDN